MKILSNAVAYVANEIFVLGQYAIVQGDIFPTLWTGNDNASFDRRVNRIREHLGGPPELYVLRDGEEPPSADNYSGSVIREVFDVFHRARNSVIRAHMFMTGSWLLAKQPDIMMLPNDPDAAAMFSKQAGSAFWEHAEAGYIRLYSFWDRVAQVLDFAFFNIRKFDQNGFTTVMDRIHANVVPMDGNLKNSYSWKRLRSFQTSEKEDGMKWLLQRRNLVVHSLHLHPVQDNEKGVFNSQFNHLDAAHRERLRPRDSAEEIKLLLGQLTRACELFSDFMTVVEFAPSRKGDSWF